MHPWSALPKRWASLKNSKTTCLTICTFLDSILCYTVWETLEKRCYEMKIANKVSSREWREWAGMIPFQSYHLNYWPLPLSPNSILRPNGAIFLFIYITCIFLTSCFYSALPSSLSTFSYIFAFSWWKFFPFCKVLLKSYFIHVTIFYHPIPGHPLLNHYWFLSDYFNSMFYIVICYMPFDFC